MKLLIFKIALPPIEQYFQESHTQIGRISLIVRTQRLRTFDP